MGRPSTATSRRSVERRGAARAGRGRCRPAASSAAPAVARRSPAMSSRCRRRDRPPKSTTARETPPATASSTVDVAGRAIIRLAQRQPLGGKSAHASRPTPARTVRPACRQVGRLLAAARAPAVSRARSGRFANHPHERLSVNAATSSGGTSTPALGGTVSGIAPAVVADHRQAVGDRLGIGHAVTFDSATAARTDRRPHRASRGALATRRRALSRDRRDAKLAISPFESSRRSRIAVRSPAMTSRHGKIARSAKRRDQHVISLARHDGADGQQIDVSSPTACGAAGADRCPAGRWSVRLRHAVIVRQQAAPSPRWW